MRKLINFCRKEWLTLSFIVGSTYASVKFAEWTFRWFVQKQFLGISWMNYLVGSLLMLAIVQGSENLWAMLIRGTREGRFKKILSDREFAQKFRCLEMLWPKRVRNEIWQPAFHDALATYNELRPISNLRWLNFLFASKMMYWTAVTLRIAILDWRVFLLSSRRTRLTNRTRPRKD